MKKPTLWLIIMILAVGALFASALRHEEASMKLINTQTGYVVVEFKDGQVFFNDRFLEAEMTEVGIAIPQALQNEFEGKKAIHPNDRLFQKAFIEVYVPLAIASPIYQWQK